jgi:hypothetical protein
MALGVNNAVRQGMILKLRNSFNEVISYSWLQNGFKIAASQHAAVYGRSIQCFVGELHFNGGP